MSTEPESFAAPADPQPTAVAPQHPETEPLEQGALTDDTYWHWPRAAVVWALSAVGAIVVVSTAGAEQQISWMAVVLVGALLLTFCLQLGTAQKWGFIDRTAVSISGAVLAVVVVFGVAALL